MGIHLTIANPLLVYNTGIARSLTDAESYLSARGLPLNVVGINFGAVGTYVPTYSNPLLGGSGGNLSDGTLSVQAGTFKWQGISYSTFDGLDLLDFLQYYNKWQAFSPSPDAIVCSTYTPLVAGGGGIYYILPAVLGVNFSGGVIGTLYDPQYSVPHGRLGCPANIGDASANFVTEMTPKGGGSIAQQCYNNAIAAERAFNFRLPHVLSSTGGPYVAPAPPGYDAAYWPTLMAAARSRYVNVTYDLCSAAYPCGTSAANDFLNGVVSPPLPIFGLCCPFNANDDNNPPGSHVYSNNYIPLLGAWSAHWYSFQWYWSLDFLYNGGSAAYTTIAEPYENGIHDPKQFLIGLMSGLSMAECLPWSVSPAADSYVDVSTCQRQTVIGDPLYRPYAIQTPLPGAAYFPGLLV